MGVQKRAIVFGGGSEGLRILGNSQAAAQHEQDKQDKPTLWKDHMFLYNLPTFPARHPGLPKCLKLGIVLKSCSGPS